MRRRGLLRTGVVGLGILAGCTRRARQSREGSETPTSAGTATGTPTGTPACADDTYRDETGDLDLEFGHETPDDTTYEATLRVYHVSTPVCRYRSTPCDEAPAEELVEERTLYVSTDTDYGVVPLPVSRGVDTYRVEFSANGKTVEISALEQAARSFVDESYPIYVCDPGARRLGFLVEAGEPRIVDV